MENRDFRIAVTTRKKIREDNSVFPSADGAGNLYREASLLAYKYNEEAKKSGASDFVSPAKLHASALLHLIYQLVLDTQTTGDRANFFSRSISSLNSDKSLMSSLDLYAGMFPSPALEEKKPDPEKRTTENIRGFFVHQLLIQNPALLDASKPFIAPEPLPDEFKALSSVLSSYPKDDLRDGSPNTDDIFTFLNLPARLFPNSLEGQIKYAMREWASLLPDDILALLELSLDYIREEEKPRFGGPGPTRVLDYSSELNEYEAFSADSNWMPRVVMMAKCTYVWLDQLSKSYKRPITRLDQIPDEELDLLRDRGFTALWLIGLWERSEASKKIKNLTGNPEAEASAYSLKDYEISSAIGGWSALENLRWRCSSRGIRLASDMVPNHTGMDGTWVYEHPDYYIQQDYPPFPSYTYNGPDLSDNPRYEIKIEDHYYERSDAAVTFMLRDKETGRVRFIFHGNDGTSMPWNDTAQLDYLNPETREAVIQKILHVARNFPIIRFDAAMTLAKRHIQRLWYPRPGFGGDIAGRTSHSMSEEDFNSKIPEEFWREVVDRVAVEAPDTLLLAEAFWMMEGYFVRTLGMHRVYNSAFMNMLKNQENKKYRESIKNTLVFEPEILKRYVNFMNNPDEETAIAQFGDGDRYFAICTLLATLPGLPMVGHGQIEGFREKYGMEYRKAYYNETPNGYLIGEHYRRIFPLFRTRYLFSEVQNFQLYDCYNMFGSVEESVYAFVNGYGKERVLVLVNNRYERAGGTIHTSVPKLSKEGDGKSAVTTTLGNNLGLSFSGNSYVLADLFLTDLTFILPSMLIFEEGFSFELSGYEAKIFRNIREVEDADGNYGKIWNEYGRNGISNISKALALLRLKPLHKALEVLKSDATYRLVEDLVRGRLNKDGSKALLLKIAECYSSLPEVWKLMGETGRDQVEIIPADIEPAPVVKIVKKLVSLFTGRRCSSFASLASVDSSIPAIITAALCLFPFCSKLGPKEAVREADRLFLDTFLEERLRSIGCEGEEGRKIIHFAALLLTAGIYRNNDDIESFKNLFEDPEVRNLAGCNEYQGVVWYNKEGMQKLVLIVAASWSLRPTEASFNPDAFVKKALTAELFSEYRLSSFLESLSKSG